MFKLWLLICAFELLLWRLLEQRDPMALSPLETDILTVLKAKGEMAGLEIMDALHDLHNPPQMVERLVRTPHPLTISLVASGRFYVPGNYSFRVHGIPGEHRLKLELL